MPLSTRTKWEIVFLATHNRGPKLSPKQISKEVRCGESTVKFWLKRFRETGDVEELPRSGRPRKTTEEEDEVIVGAVKEDDEVLIKDIATKLKRQRIEISPSTIRRRLVEAGVEWKPVIMKPLLSENHRRNRLEWAQQHIEINWNEILFTDESTIKLFYYRSKAWRKPGGRVVRRTVKHPVKMHIWGCMSSGGFGKAYVFKENLNAQLLCKIYRKALLPSAEELFQGDWLLQEDNDPKHKSKVATKWREENGVDRMEWPSQSPDLNCIEHVWRLLKLKVGARKPGDSIQLARVIKQEWRKLPTELAVNLVGSMGTRLEACINAEGDYTMY
jgi:transposase